MNLRNHVKIVLFIDTQFFAEFDFNIFIKNCGRQIANRYISIYQYEVIKPVLERIHIESMNTIDFYKQTAGACGLDFMSFKDMSQHLVIHFTRIYEELDTHFDELLEMCSTEYLHNMKAGLNHWINTGKTGYIIRGFFKFCKSH